MREANGSASVCLIVGRQRLGLDLPGANVTRAGDQNVSAKLIKRRTAATAAVWSWEKLSLTSLG